MKYIDGTDKNTIIESCFGGVIALYLVCIYRQVS